jgi:hypothetical protein
MLAYQPHDNKSADSLHYMYVLLIHRIPTGNCSWVLVPSHYWTAHLSVILLAIELKAKGSSYVSTVPLTTLPLLLVHIFPCTRLHPFPASVEIERYRFIVAAYGTRVPWVNWWMFTPCSLMQTWESSTFIPHTYAKGKAIGSVRLSVCLSVYQYKN